MAAGHSHLLYRHGGSVVHRLPAHVKIVSLVAFVLIVVAAPPDRFWAFPVYAALLALVAVLARIPATFIVRRMVVEIPFVVFALLMPVVSTGERSDVLGISLSDDGLLAGWNILAKGTLGVVASILLAATTDARALLVGLQRLRLPNRLVEIAAFMVRYGDVVAGEMQRMRGARESRAFEARHMGHLRGVAQGAARAERGEKNPARAQSHRHPHRRCRDGARRRVGCSSARPGHASRGQAAGRNRLPGPRRPAVHADGSRRCGVRPGKPRVAGPGPRGAGRGGAGRSRHVRGGRPPAPSPVVRPAAPGRRGDSPGDGTGGARSGRAHEQSRPGQPAGAGRGTGVPAGDHARGDPRPPVRPRAVRTLRRPLGWDRRGRRAYRRRSRGRGSAGRASSGASLRLRPALGSGPAGWVRWCTIHHAGCREVT